mgnify:CR=1 FL=1
MEIALGADHAGFALKEKVKQELERLGHRVQDVGTASAEPVDYPDYAASVARRVAGGRAERGILVCATGAGMALAANKVRGIRAVSVWNAQGARLSRQHNDANVLALGARLLEEHNALSIVRAWLETEFAGGRHRRRLRKIAALERNQA